MAKQICCQNRRATEVEIIVPLGGSSQWRPRHFETNFETSKGRVWNQYANRLKSAHEYATEVFNKWLAVQAGQISIITALRQYSICRKERLFKWHERRWYSWFAKTDRCAPEKLVRNLTPFEHKYQATKSNSNISNFYCLGNVEGYSLLPNSLWCF